MRRSLLSSIAPRRDHVIRLVLGGTLRQSLGRYLRPEQHGLETQGLTNLERDHPYCPAKLGTYVHRTINAG